MKTVLAMGLMILFTITGLDAQESEFPRKFNFGIITGIQQSKLKITKGELDPVFFNPKWENGFLIGFNGNVNFNKHLSLAIQPIISYEEFGFGSIILNGDTTEIIGQNIYLDFGLQHTFHQNIHKDFNPGLIAGVKFRRGLRTKTKGLISTWVPFSSSELILEGGIGATIRVGGLRLNPQLLYSRNVAFFNSNDPSIPEATVRLRPQSFSLRLVVLLI